ncbi:SURF1 family protein [Alteromonas portus]|uniref:SURF1-like protein n=1 Tax=Alteromonas portus TaxID=2565549 RepID=A0A4U0ZGT9_9ALTE|nr:SURF1 family protein [Alteromonas portus]TKB02643.1 SURF1 family protein [Alteromonas portus]
MFSRTRHVIPWLLTGFSVAIMCGLGYWQLDRMVQKQQRLASIAQKQNNGTLSLEAALAHDDPRDINVSFSGSLDANHVLLLDNQIYDQRVGFDVIAPVYTNAGWLLVNFGWVPAPDLTRTLPDIRFVGETREFSGVISVPGHNPLVKETNMALSQSPALIQHIEFPALNSALERKFLPFTLQLTTPDPAFIREHQAVVMSPEKHLGYAVQWFGLAIAAAAIGGFAISKKGRSYE